MPGEGVECRRIGPDEVHVKVELLSPEDPKWARALQRVAHDFYHIPAYVALCAEAERGTASALWVEDGEHLLLQPLLARPTPPELEERDAWDAASPYGYSGPLVRGDDAFVSRALNDARPVLRDWGCACLFVRLHPLLDAPIEALAAHGSLEEHGETVFIDLREGEADHWRQTRAGHRNAINRSQREQHVARIDDTFGHLPAFASMYRRTMERVGATKYYLFDDAYFTALREALGQRLRLAVVEIGGELAAGALFTEVDGLIQYHLSATDERFLRQQPNKLILHFVRADGRQRGARWLHLGGGLGGQADSLFSFKAGFSQHRATFRTWRWVVNPERYAAMVGKRHGQEGRLDGTGYFPDYRRPAR